MKTTEITRVIAKKDEFILIAEEYLRYFGQDLQSFNIGDMYEIPEFYNSIETGRKFVFEVIEIEAKDNKEIKKRVVIYTLKATDETFKIFSEDYDNKVNLQSFLNRRI